MLGAGFVRGRLQRAEQELQPARSVSWNLRQFRRRIRQFLWLLEVLSDRGRGCCSDDRCKENCEPRSGGESHSHGESLDAAKAACKADLVPVLTFMSRRSRFVDERRNQRDKIKYLILVR